MLFANVFPSFTAPNGFRGRRIVGEAFIDYFKNKGHEQGSVFARNRHNVSVKHGISIEDTAKFECGGGIAILLNTIPATFWMLFHIYSEPEILQSIRDEVSTLISNTKADTGEIVRSIDMSKMKTNCPLLTSTFQEVMRFRGVGTSVRQVMEDTVLNNEYLLKKDAMIQMPSRVIHMDPGIWGEDVKTFNHRRFMKEYRKAERIRSNPAAFRGFGGGHTLCPGRHFATTEIMAFIMMMVMRYDLTPNKKVWKAPTCNKTGIAAQLMEPDFDISLSIKTRGGFEDGKWAFSLAGSENIFAMAVEDLK